MQKISDVAIRNRDISAEKAGRKAHSLLEEIRKTQFISISFDEMDKMYVDMIDLMESQIYGSEIMLKKVKESRKK